MILSIWAKAHKKNRKKRQGKVENLISIHSSFANVDKNALLFWSCLVIRKHGIQGLKIIFFSKINIKKNKTSRLIFQRNQPLAIRHPSLLSLLRKAKINIWAIIFKVNRKEKININLRRIISLRDKLQDSQKLNYLSMISKILSKVVLLKITLAKALETTKKCLCMIFYTKTNNPWVLKILNAWWINSQLSIYLVIKQHQINQAKERL